MKYPFGAAHMILWALRPTIQNSPEGRALIAHADSTFYVCAKYNQNARAWASRLFDGLEMDPLLESLLSGEYLETHVEAHTSMVEMLRPWTKAGASKAYDSMDPAWKVVMGVQTCKGYRADRVMANILGMCNVMTQILKLHPVMNCHGNPRVFWEGKLQRVSPIPEGNLAIYVERSSGVSHAVIGFNTLSYTKGGDLDDTAHGLCFF